jgi:hypothetical protein
MSRKIEKSSDAGSFVCEVPDGIPEVFVDGVSQIAVGMPNSKILFHSVAPTPGEDSERENRVARLTLVIPTAALFEFIANIATSTGDEVMAQTSKAGNLYQEQVVKQMLRLSQSAEQSKTKSDLKI